MAILSVIVPVKDDETHIKRCIDSVVNQSLKDIDVLIIDDGSKDNTASLVKEHFADNTNVSLFRHMVNMGTGQARNTGIRHSHSKYIAFLDSDDWIDTNAYVNMINSLETTNADIAVCGIMTEYSSPLLSSVRYSYTYGNHINADFALKLLSRNEKQDSYISPLVGNKVFRKTLLTQNNLLFPKRCNFEDDEFMFKALIYATTVALVPDSYLHYYQREGSAMHTFSRGNVDDFIFAFKELRSFLEEEQKWSVKISEYYAFFDKCIASLLNSLFVSEQRVDTQREYITYLMERILDNFTIKELLSFIEPCRLARLWN